MATILVVDDNASNFDTIESIFAHEEVDLFYSSSGIHTLDLLETLSVDVILLDVMMPDMDGIEVCRRVKENPKWSCIPIIMVTALDSKEDLAYCLQTGADDFVAKPINSLELRARVRSMLRIKEQYDDLQQLVQVRSDLTKMIIHDLRNPLRTMMLASEILKRTPLTEKQQQKVDQIYRNGQQAIFLIDNQLVMAKIEAGFLSVESAEVDLALMIQDILEELQLLADKYGLRWVTDFPDQTRLINSDKNLLKRIVENLLANAIKFSNSGQKITIRLEYPTEMKVRLSVIDEGKGVSDELKNIIFNQFEVGHSFNDAKQMGLGLAFCKLAIEALGGNILVQDNQPQGAIFILEI